MKKSIAKISVILMIILIVLQACSYAANVTAGYTFGINNMRTDGANKYAYAFAAANDTTQYAYVWNVQRYNNSIAVTDETYYCLAHKYGDFPSFGQMLQQNTKVTDTVGISTSSYTGAYNLKETGVIDTINALYNGTKGNTLTGTTYNSILWILDHMYVAGEDNLDDFLKKIECVDTDSYEPMTDNVYNEMQLINGTDHKLTDIDMEVIQQLAMWYFTNSEAVNQYPAVYLSVNGGNLGTYSDVYNTVYKEGHTYGEIRDYFANMVFNYLVEGAKDAAANKYTGDNITTALLYVNSKAQPVVRVTREKQLTGKYNVVLKKVDGNGQILPGAKFTVNGNEFTTGANGEVQIANDVEITENNVSVQDKYTIVETLAPNGYIKYDGTITATIGKGEADDGLSYIPKTATLDDTSKNSGAVSIKLDNNTNTITITVKDEKITGKYNVVLKKINENGQTLSGAKFTVNGNEFTTGANGEVQIANNVNITADNLGVTDNYTIIETLAPNGYIKYDGTINLAVTKKLAETGKNYEINSATLDDTSRNSGYVTLDNDTSTITITVKDRAMSGRYSVRINKQNEEGEVLQNAVFKINGTEYPATDSKGFVTIIDNKEITANDLGVETFELEEIIAPDGYLIYDGKITLTITKGILADGVSYGIVDKSLDATSTASNRVRVELDSATNTVTVIIIEEKIEGVYNVKINKQNEEGEVLQNAIFTINGTEYPATDSKGFVTIVNNKEITEDNLGTEKFVLKEIKAPEGYLIYSGEITLTITKALLENGKSYGVTDATLDETSIASNRVKVKLDKDTNTVTVIIIEEKIEGNYTVKINKQDQNRKVLQGATFTVNDNNYTTDADGYATIVSKKEINEQNVNEKDKYTMKEIKAPDGYVVYDGTIELTVTKKQDGERYILDTATIDETSKASGKVDISIDKQTNTITVIVIEDNIDLSLRKFISKVVDEKGNKVYTDAELANRIPDVKTEKLVNGSATTADYNHDKEPVIVSIGNTVTYTLRVYNEGNTDAYITKITDYLSSYLEFVSDEEWYIEYGQDTDNYATKVTSSGITKITGASENLTNLVGTTIGDGILLPAFDKTTGKISYIDVQVSCKVLEPKAEEGQEKYKITNIAEITGMLDKDKNEINQDVDSRKDNVNLPEDEKSWQEYKDEEIGKKDYIPGQEDDDDFEKVIIVAPKYDLSLRKFIIAVNNTKLVDANGKYTREPQVDTTSLKQGIIEKTYGTATYNHTKEPVTVRRGDIVTYVIRVYNEGNMDAYVSKITDHLPEYLEYLKDDEQNKAYGWNYDENTREISTQITSKTSNDTTGIYADRENGKLLLAFNGGNTLDYIDVEIKCKVSAKATANENQTNIADITDFTNKNDEKVEDVDSKPDGNLEIPTDKDLPNYKEDEIGKKDYIPGQEDDDDFEKVFVKGEFDLALRKFITKVNTVNVNNRYPNLSMGEDGNIKYTHTKEPVEVCYQDTVIYTIRIYNEGEVDGYANEITDDVPEGLEFIVDNDTNKTYRWKMLDENEEETKDVSKAKYLVTDYLSEEQEKATGRTNKIKAYDAEKGITNDNPDYRDVQIAFKVTYQVTDPNEESRILVNVAQISADSDDDKDSKPNRDEKYDDKDHEDDIDYEQVKVKYFDLSLLKWVSQAIVVENGNTTVTETGHTGYENPEPVVKVEIKSKDINKVTVKFAYKIKITNEGEIAGYAKEITDYIPEGLKFVKEDNPDWYERADGKVATAQLENTLLQPGESAEVEIILTWINGEKNLGTKINIAEISKDENPSHTPDIDSTPDNEVPGEDDIDDAPVMLVIKTGTEVQTQYTILTTVVVAILTIGVIGIKKFVM